MHVESVISELSTYLSIHDLKLDNDGSCRVIFDERLVVDMKHMVVNDSLRLYGVIRNHAEDLTKSDYQAILAANLTERSNSDVYFAFDETLNEIVLLLNFVLETIVFSDFIAQLESYVDLYEKWFDDVEAGLVFGNNEVSNTNDVKELEQDQRLKL